MDSPIVGAGAFLRTRKGTFLFQKRDSNTDKDPDMIAPFGGALNYNETPMNCIKRELKEELELLIEASNMNELGDFDSNNIHGSCIRVFIINDVDKSKLNLHEGEAIVEMTLKEAEENPNVTKFTKEVINSIH